ncbi:Syntaxin-71 [Hordeum vulgare]|nr:Syntaxin-71 [Hordeum vulgare]
MAAVMMVIDILTRVYAISQKDDKYDAEKLNGANIADEEPFARLYGSANADISQCIEVPPPHLLLLSPSPPPGAASLGNLNLTSFLSVAAAESGGGEVGEEPGRGRRAQCRDPSHFQQSPVRWRSKQASEMSGRKGGERKKSVSKSEKVGLQFPVSRGSCECI